MSLPFGYDSSRLLHHDVDGDARSRWWNTRCRWNTRCARLAGALAVALLLVALFAVGRKRVEPHTVAPPTAMSIQLPARYSYGVDAAGAELPFSHRWCPPPRAPLDVLPLQPYETHRTLIAVIAFNRPDFLPWQHRSLQTFLPNGSYVHYVFDDSRADQPHMTAAIRAHAQQLGLTYVRVPQNAHQHSHPSFAHGEIAIFIWRYVLAMKWQGPLWFMDPDMFLISPWRWDQVLPPGAAMATVPQPRVDENGKLLHYLYANLMLFAAPLALPHADTLEFMPIRFRGVDMDTGGATIRYLEAHPEQRLHALSSGGITPPENRRAWDNLSSEMRERLARNAPLISALFPVDPSDESLDYVFINEFSILHFRAASDWDHKNTQQIDTKWKLISSALDEAVRLHEQDRQVCALPHAREAEAQPLVSLEQK